MTVNTPINNNADNSVFRNTSNELYNNSLKNKPSALSYGMSTVALDSLDSVPIIEHYNNYSQNGVIADSIVTRFNINSIPESQGIWGTWSLPPFWDSIPHKGMTDLSKDEIKELMLELADRFRNTTSGRERSRLANQADTLQAWYISHGSGAIDRKAIFDNAMRTIRQHAGGRKKVSEETIPRTLLCHLLKRDGINTGITTGMTEGKAYPMAGGGTVTGRITGSGEAAEFDVVHQGQKVMTIYTGAFIGVHFTAATPEESRLQEEINTFWFDAIRGS